MTEASRYRCIRTPAEVRSWGDPVIAAPAATADASSFAILSDTPAVAAPTSTATAVALELQALGVEHFFLMTGRDNSLWIALESLGIRQVLARSEAAAVYMADAYARMTGRPTFVYGAYGPGAANVAGSMAEPFWSGSPVIALASAMRRGERFRKEYLELDQPALFASVS